MAAKPAKLVALVKGKAIGAHKGFVATWNYICGLVDHFASGKAAGKGVKTSGFVVGTPKIEVEIIGKDGVKATCGGPGMPYVITLTGGGRDSSGDNSDAEPSGGGDDSGGGGGGTEPSFKFVGTDSTTAVLGTAAAADVDSAHTVNFHAASNSNVVVTCSGGGGNAVDITIGVYYT